MHCKHFNRQNILTSTLESKQSEHSSQLLGQLFIVVNSIILEVLGPLHDGHDPVYGAENDDNEDDDGR